MNAVTAPARHTPADLLRMPDGDRYELVDGTLVERVMSTWSSYVAGELLGRLRDFCRANSQGWVLPEGTSYQCFPDTPSRVRRADVSFIRQGRLSLEQATAEGHLSITPDLAVEVVSPNDLAYDIDAKVQEFLRAGAQLVWVVNPTVRTVEVHRPRGTGTILREEDDLEGGDVLSGFVCRVGDLFLPPPGVGQAPAGNS